MNYDVIIIGAGAFSDGKYNITNDFGGTLYEYMITVLRGKITSAEAQLEALKQEDAAQKAVSESIIPAYRQFKTWAEEFDSAPWEMKKMIANQLFSKVEITSYKIVFQNERAMRFVWLFFIFIDIKNGPRITVFIA